jgi:zinc transport system ATP-binding protein
MKQNTLEVFQNSRIIFHSDKKWLYPVFDFEDFLKAHTYDHTSLNAHDKVVGKAAALLMIRLGVGNLHGDVMSQLADDVLTRVSMNHSYDKLVERIDCQTEEILSDIDDADTAYEILCKRAKRC